MGISSLFLIMFYPNKITFFNSFITFFFNRLGDIFFLIFFCFFLENYSLFYYLNNFNFFIVMFFFFLSLITKRAQLPFSSWLPAAMSAPTPISAIVHSSTLVTAGILVLFKFFNYFNSQGLIFFLLILRFLTFILGGRLANLEKDLKKIVAFSTIRQISIILFFLCLSLFSLAFLHTLGHALFKTLLFCRCGAIFVWIYRDQILVNVPRRIFFVSMVPFFVLRIYAIRGMIFSSSFYTKDLVLEYLLEEKRFILFIFLILGRFITVGYRVKIFSSLVFGPRKKFFFCLKEFQFFFIFFFSIVLTSLIKLVIDFSFSDSFCFVS